MGYGDLYPVTDLGRLIAACLIVAGIGLMGTFTAYVASLFLGTNQRETHYEQELLLELRDFRTELELLEARLEAATTERQRPPHQNP